MKKVLARSVVVLMVLFLSAGLGLAGGKGQGGGKGGGGSIGGGGGNGGGTGPIHDIFAGEPFDYLGEVTGIATGGGIIIDTGDDEVSIYGIGSDRYWDSLVPEVDRPAVGDTIDVNGYNVVYSKDVLRNIAMEITVGGVTVELRDPDTGVPLWRGSANSN